MTYLDPYGIGAAQFMALDLFENASRVSGRTQYLTHNAMPGDAIVVPTRKLVRIYMDALHMARMLPVDGYNGHNDGTVAVLVVDPAGGPSAKMGTNPHGHTYLSHDYVLEAHRHALKSITTMMANLEADMSKDPPSRETYPYRRGIIMNETAYARHPL